MFYFKLTNGAMVKCWMVQWFNDQIKIRIGRFFHKNIKSVYLYYFQTQHFSADKTIHNLQFLITINKYSNQVYLIILRINNKQTFICHCNAYFSVVFSQNGKNEYNFVNILSNIATPLFLIAQSNLTYPFSTKYQQFIGTK